ncbi:MAG: VWA domain-containing protein [Planctomycetes bacterium]|nr:VWA domain-containing protein [Planctomycetota bacterium]
MTLGLSLLYAPRLPRRLLIASTALRAAVLVLLLLAAAQPFWRHMHPAPLDLTFLLDVSDSVSREERRTFLEILNSIGQQLDEEERSRLIVFGSDARLVREDRGAVRHVEQAYEMDGGRTHLASALRMALFHSDPGSLRRVVLFSDGNQNLEDAAVVLPLLRQLQIPVFTFGPRGKRPESSRHPYFEQLSAPQQVGGDERFYLHLFLRNPTSAAISAAVRVRWDDAALGEHRLVLPPGLTPFRLVQHEAREGIHSVRAELELPDASRGGPFSALGFVHVIGKPRVMLVDRDEGRRRFLAELLEKDFVVDERYALTADFQDLLRAECIILNDVPTTELRRGEMDLLARVVQDTGAGLLVVGGDDENGMSSYRRTRLEDVLPVRLDLRSSKGRRDFALVLAIDKSGSMDGEKIEMAHRSAIKAVESLEPGDVIGVLAFDAAPQWLVPLTTLETDRQPVIESINALEAGGGTDARFAIQVVFQELLHRQMNIKQHVVLISDGITDEAGFVAMAEQMVQADITVSVIAIGEGANLPLLESLKRAGRGEFFHVTDLQNLPQIVLRDMEERMQKVNLIRTEFQPRLFEPHPITKGIDGSSLPLLRSYSLSQLKSAGHKPLTTNFKNTEDPILAAWIYGLGKCSAMLSGLRTGWLGVGTDWKQFGTLWSQLVRWTARSDSLDHPLLKLAREGDRLRLEIRVPIKAEDVPQGILARLSGPEGNPIPIPLEQKTPFDYTGEVQIDSTASHALVIEGYRASGPWVQAYPIHIPTAVPIEKLPVESPHERPNLVLLERLAKETGGAFEADPGWVLRRGDPVEERKEYWPALVILAMALFLADVALRRMSL